MDEQAFDKYRNERLAEQLSFYDARSVSNKRWHRILSVYVILASGGMMPLVALAPAEPEWRLAETLISGSIVAVTAIVSHFKFHENWLSFRAYWDALKREEQFHDARIREYQSHADPHALFVERAEAIMARESAEFYRRNEQTEQEQKPAPKKKR